MFWQDAPHKLARCRARYACSLTPVPRASPLRCSSFSVASSGGSLARTGWLGMLGQRLTGALRRAPHSVNPSEMGSPRSGALRALLLSRDKAPTSTAYLPPTKPCAVHTY